MNLQTTITLLFLLIANLVSGQICAKVIDDNSHELIPYVNIWLKSKVEGTTSNIKGEFVLHGRTNMNDMVVFPAIGYETMEIELINIHEFVKLKPRTYVINEISVYPKKTITTKIGVIDKKSINRFFSCVQPILHARFFPYKEEYDTIPYIKNISFYTQSNIENAKFNVRLYSAGKKGQLDKQINRDNIIATAKKGKHTTTVDLSSRNIRFPSEGFFVAVEWFAIRENKLL